MKVNIEKISDCKLRLDLADSYKDVADCMAALEVGVTQYSGGAVQERIDQNKHFIKVITAELERRKVNAEG